MATSGRDARRRKIVDRGSDRLALISGRIQNLSSSSTTQPHHSSTLSTPELFFDYQKLQSHRPTQSSVSFHGKEDASDSDSPKYEIRNESASNAASGTDSTKYEIRNEFASNAATGTMSRMEPHLKKCETSIDYLRTAPLDISGKPPASITLSSSKAQKLSTSMVDAEPRSEPQQHHSRIFTANRISSSISASERTRLLCSIGIAIIVVLSHLRFPLLGSSFVRSTIAAGPVYLILLTDVTLVIARLLFEEKGHSRKAKEEATPEPSEDGCDWAEGLGKALEMGLILHKVIGAAFLDCSVYLVIIICGLSLV
ncbi:uncharacterized protein LOC122653039 isoform X1 [Telopea speciosissima]|uniref:uncharacterized protein LOC122653039 isoform X1 n=1 Tax=Telopea speciosissima TaxID=54955 RepID=UPI001CC71E04|nr:uncharacterized protein LOC122653039 isoform X1 [Telopea speciosissima]